MIKSCRLFLVFIYSSFLSSVALFPFISEYITNCSHMGCKERCAVTPAGPACYCKTGYEISPDGKTCKGEFL